MAAPLLARLALRFGLLAAGAITAFAISSASDSPAHAAERPRPHLAKLGAHKVTRTVHFTLPERKANAPHRTVYPRPAPATEPSRKPHHHAALHPRWRPSATPARGALPAPVEHTVDRVTAPVRHALTRVERVTRPVLKPTGAALDEAPGPAGALLTRARGTVAATTGAVTCLTAAVSPALGTTVQAALTPLRPVLGEDEGCGLINLPPPLHRVPPEAEPSVSLEPATERRPQITIMTVSGNGGGQLQVAAPSHAHPGIRGPAIGSSDRAAAADEPPMATDTAPRDPQRDPGAPTSSGGHGSTDLGAAYPPDMQHTPRAAASIVPSGQHHRPAGRNPKPTPGPA